MKGFDNVYGIYIHIPFCKSKCKYCDFASFSGKENIHNDYILKLTKDIQKRRGVSADTIYIGGGTPSVLSEENLQTLLESIRDNICFAHNGEFTVEVNPGTVTRRKAELMREYGVNRVSMGAQSFSDEELRILGRIHSVEDTERTYSLLRDVGFANINLDLMYALPGQSMNSFVSSVDRMISLSPEHISCYGLKIEEDTPYYEMLKNGIIEECDEDLFADMYYKMSEIFTLAGYEHYEISNFSKTGFESHHNLKYWQDGDYLGFGVAAASREGNRRYTNPYTLDGYMTDSSLSEDILMDIDEQMSEFIILGLRVIKNGVDKQKFKDKFGVEADDVFASSIERVKDSVINTKTSLKLRKEALLVSNSIMCEFMGE